MYGLSINLIEILGYVLAQRDCKTVALWFTYCFVRSHSENHLTHNHKPVVN